MAGRPLSLVAAARVDGATPTFYSQNGGFSAIARTTGGQATGDWTLTLDGDRAIDPTTAIVVVSGEFSSSVAAPLVVHGEATSGTETRVRARRGNAQYGDGNFVVLVYQVL